MTVGELRSLLENEPVDRMVVVGVDFSWRLLETVRHGVYLPKYGSAWGLEKGEKPSKEGVDSVLLIGAKFIPRGEK